MSMLAIMDQQVIRCNICTPVQKSPITRDPSAHTHVGDGKLITLVVSTDSCQNHVTSLIKESVMDLRSMPEQLNEEYNGLNPASRFILNSISNSTLPNSVEDWILQHRETLFCPKTMQGTEQNNEKEITTTYSSGILGDVAYVGESEAQVPSGEVMIGREEKEVCCIVDRRTSTYIEEWEVDEAEPLCMQQQPLITEKEKCFCLGETEFYQTGKIVGG